MKPSQETITAIRAKAEEVWITVRDVTRAVDSQDAYTLEACNRALSRLQESLNLIDSIPVEPHTEEEEPGI